MSEESTIQKTKDNQGNQANTQCNTCNIGYLREITILKEEKEIDLLQCDNCNYNCQAPKEQDEILQLRQVYKKKVYGYPLLKEDLIRITKLHLEKKLLKPSHTILCGAAGCCKTYFFELMTEVFDSKEIGFINAATTSSSGLLDYLMKDNRVNLLKILILDEIDKMAKIHQKALLTALESGKMIKTKYRQIIELDVSRIQFYATANEKEKIYQPLRTRFTFYNIPEYPYVVYRNIVDSWIKRIHPDPYVHEPLIKILYPQWDESAPRIHIRTVKRLIDKSQGDPIKLTAALKVLTTYGTAIGE